MATSADERDVVPKGRKPTSKELYSALETRLDRLEEVVVRRLASIEEALLGPGKSDVPVEQFRWNFLSLAQRTEDLEEKRWTSP